MKLESPALRLRSSSARSIASGGITDERVELAPPDPVRKLEDERWIDFAAGRGRDPLDLDPGPDRFHPGHRPSGNCKSAPPCSSDGTELAGAVDHGDRARAWYRPAWRRRAGAGPTRR